MIKLFKTSIHTSYSKLLTWILKTIEVDVLKSRVNHSPYTLSKVLTVSTFSLTLISTLTILVIVVYRFTLNVPYIVLLLLLPFTPLLILKTWLKTSILNYKVELDNEVALFKVYCGMLAYEGLHLYEILEKTVGSEIFPRLSCEAKRIIRNVKVLGLDFKAAIEEAVKHSPSNGLKELLRNYVALELSGGDTSRFLEEEAVRALEAIEVKARNYAESISLYGELTIGIYLLTSMLVSLGLILSLDVAREVLISYLTLIAPLTTVMLLLFLNNSQITFNVKCNPPLKLVLGGILSLFTPSLIIGFNIASISAGLTFTTIILGVHYYFFKRLGEVEEAQLSTLLRGLIEYRKLGYTPYQGLERMVRDGIVYGKIKRVVIDYMYKVKAGTPPSKARVDSPSKLVRLVFRILGDVEEAGGGSPLILEKLYDVTVKIRDVKKRISLASRLYEALAYLTPILLSLTSGLTLAFYKIFPEDSLGLNVYFQGVYDVVSELLKLQILSSSISVGLITSKATTSSIRATYKVGGVLLVATLTIQFLDLVTNIIAGMLV